ncbi:MAG TPA: hypothetical protein DD473_21170 [Planctomycetaceae bacterium]|nr:hypothetical protein [Planctomycetaceae bacterium]
MLLKIPYLYLTRIRNCFQALMMSLVLCAFAGGCGSDTPDSSEVLDDSWFELENEEKVANDAPAEPTAATASLGVKLEQGARFPLQKVVEKTLTQKTTQGTIENQERIELDMAVTVEEIRDKYKLFSVRYNRVKYQTNLNGQQVFYDSQQPPYPVPDGALVYHGMVNNGFSFWVGPDNKITEVINFNEFMKRCLLNVPQQKAEAVSQMLAQYSGQQGIANFVDDTIGLLPYDPESSDGSMIVRLGGNWTKSRQFSDPVPMSINNTYTLRELNEEYAKVEIMGNVSPSSASSNPGSDSVSLQVRDGHSAGMCTIDRKTGLPLESRIDHLLNMTVQANGMMFEQQKRVVTSIRMFPEQTQGQLSRLTARKSSMEHSHQHSDSNIQPASHEIFVPEN